MTGDRQGPASPAASGSGGRELAILGAGPKAMAIAAKAQVLASLGFAVPRITIFEKRQVAHHWLPDSGLTHGQLPLGTPPDKDVGFPYYSFLWGDAINQRINESMQAYSWQTYLIRTHQFAEWTDRGRPSPTHREWAAYLRWVFARVRPGIRYNEAEVKELDLVGRRWTVRAVGPGGSALEAEFDGIVITGPGDVKLPVEIPAHPRLLTVTDFWSNYRSYLQVEGRSAAIVGSGETAATVAAAFGAANPGFAVDIISPHAMTFSRGESFAENHVYTDPFRANWLQLTKRDRREFMRRTDRGVFSVTVQQELDRLRNVEIIPGMFTGLTIDSVDQLLARIQYANDRETRIYDYIIVSVGFDHVGFVNRLLSERARQALADHLRGETPPSEATGKPGAGDEPGRFPGRERLEDSIDRFLAVGGFRPMLHLPMLAGLAQGPGFPNLSCLGRLSDHILAGHVPVEAVTDMENRIVIGTDQPDLEHDR